jgi:hypothetical protein
MRGLITLLAVVVFGTAIARAATITLYSSPILDVVIDNDVEISSPYGNLGQVRLLIAGKQGFEPAGFDGVMRDGVINGATGITGTDLLMPGYESRFLTDPADLLIVDPVLLSGYVPDPYALTGLFAISEPSAISPTWYLAEITAAAGTIVTLDFTIGEAGGDRTEYVGVSFDAPGEIIGPLQGDCDGDGDVDLDDFVILKTNFGTGTTHAEGDCDGDGDVDLDDFVVLKNEFGMAAAALPEPSMIALMTVAGMLLRGRRSKGSK